MRLSPILVLLCLLAAKDAMAQEKADEITVPKNKVLEVCGSQKYASVLTEIGGMKVRFFCDPYMPPLLLNGSGSSKEKAAAKPGPAVSETLPECPPTDQAYGLCEMNKLERELRQKMMDVMAKKSAENQRLADLRAIQEEERKKLPPPPPPCVPLSEGGLFKDMLSDILGAVGQLKGIQPIPGDVRLIYVIKHAALYGPLSRIREGEKVAIDAIASRSQYAVPILPKVTVTKEQAANLCLDGKAFSDAGAIPLPVVLSDYAKAKPSGKAKAVPQEGPGEEIEIDPAKGVFTVPQISPTAPTPIAPAK
jgi:hypothetical protein